MPGCHFKFDDNRDTELHGCLGMVFLAKGTTGTEALNPTEVKGLPKVKSLVAFRQPATPWHFFADSSTSKLSPGPSGHMGWEGHSCADMFSVL